MTARKRTRKPSGMATKRIDQDAATEPEQAPTGPVEREYVVTGEHHMLHHPQTGLPVGLHGSTFTAVYPPHVEARLIEAGHIKRVDSDADPQEG